jgi:N-acetylneuraminic acid mutarotase
MNSLLFSHGGVVRIGITIAAALLPLLTTSWADAAPFTFSYTGSIGEAREGYTVTVLRSGKVLVAGGVTGPSDNGEIIPRAEIYDPATGAWSAAASMLRERTGHAAVLLRNGRVLVMGGVASNGAWRVTAEYYDPSSGNWVSAGSMSIARTGHTATLLQNGKVLVVGGNGQDGLAELYDPANGTWAPTGSMSARRWGHRATLLQDGKVLVTGGATGALASPEIYDPATGEWSAAGSMVEQRPSHTATLLANGKVLVAAGGNFDSVTTAELYDPVTGTWTRTGRLAEARRSHSATLLPDGRVLVTGGVGNFSFSNDTTPRNSELYDPAAGTWRLTGRLNTLRDGHTATLLVNGNVLILGGTDANGRRLRSAEIYETNGPATRPRNISTRLRVETDDSVAIAGFIITGSAPKRVIVRAIGPSLTAHGVVGALVDPTLQLHKPDGTVLFNNNWREQEAAVLATNLAPARDEESAIVATLPPGAYTAIMRGNGGGTGVGLVEVYDLDPSGASTLGNISTRGQVQTGDNVMIGGFILGGSQNVTRVAIRGSARRSVPRD